MNNNKNENMNVTEKQRVYKEGDLELISACFIGKLLELNDSDREMALADLEERIIKECDNVGVDKAIVNTYLEEVRNTIKQIIRGGYEINTEKVNRDMKKQGFKKQDV